METPNSKIRDPKDVRDMFARVAPKYDLINRTMCFGLDKLWRKALAKSALKAAKKSQNSKILDLACGSGDTALEILSLDDSASVVCCDLCQEMLTLAEQKITASGFAKRAQFVCADAQNLPFKNGEFGACTISFGFRNFQKRKECLAEISRTLAPNGEVLILEVARAPRIFEWAQNLFMANFVPLAAKLCGAKNIDDYRYLAKTTREFPPQKELKKLIESSNFKNTRRKAFAFGFVALTISEKL